LCQIPEEFSIWVELFLSSAWGYIGPETCIYKYICIYVRPRNIGAENIHKRYVVVYEAGIGKESACNCESLKGRERKAEKRYTLRQNSTLLKRLAIFPSPAGMLLSFFYRVG
jgi:hypothetical protein